jgi:hypothetical protein
MSKSFNPALERKMVSGATDRQLLAKGYTIFEVAAVRAILRRPTGAKLRAAAEGRWRASREESTSLGTAGPDG